MNPHETRRDNHAEDLEGDMASREAHSSIVRERLPHSPLMDEIGSALFHSTRHMTRLCEASKSVSSASYVPNWFVRQQAMLVAESEMLKTDEFRLIMHMETDGDEIVSRAERTAGDHALAIRMALHIDPEAVTAGQIVEIWNAADRSNKRVADAQALWGLEQDALHLVGELAALDPRRNPTPFAAMEILRRLFAGRGFASKGVQMGFILAPAIIRAGFVAPRALAGIARHFRSDIYALKKLAEREDEFALAFFKAVAEDAQRTFDAMFRFGQIESKLLSMVPMERVSSMVPQAVSQFLLVPISSVPELASRMGVTRKGAQVIVERMVRGGVLQVHSHETLKGRLYVCNQAMGI